jgi:hypothetical protein
MAATRWGVGWRSWLLVTLVWAGLTALFSTGNVRPWMMAVIAAAIATQLLPPLAVAAMSRPVPPARLWIAIWALLFFVSDMMQAVIARLTGGNLWFFAIANPLEDAALLMAYSYWQVRPVMRLGFRIAIPLLALVTLAIAIGFGELNTFKAVSSPFRLLLLTTAVAYTLVVRAAHEDERIWRRDWLWTSLGVILYLAAYVVVDPVSRALLPRSEVLAQLVYVVKAVVDVVAYLMVWKGMRCPVETASSGSTSVPSWQSGSSWSR